MSRQTKLLPILWSYAKTKLRRFSSVQSLRQWQDQQVQQVLRTVLPRSPFYESYYKGLDISDWQRFPLIDKSIMMENFDQLNTVGIRQSVAMAIAQKAETTRDFRATLHGYTVGLSSGTSDNRGLFLIAQAEQQAWAGTILAKALPAPIWKPQRIAFFLRANSNLYETIQKQRIQFEYFDLFESVAAHIERLNAYQPTILVAPASMLRILAEALMAKKLLISPLKIISVAEVIEPLDEQVIQQAFMQTVHQLYQCTEGFLAATCAYGTLHLNEDILVIQKEYLDKAAGKFMPIITDFNRTTQPIIRYRLNDILTERQTPCLCGSVLTALEKIEGRCDDIFYLTSQNPSEFLRPIFPDFIRRTIIIGSDAIEAYAAVQKAPDFIEISLQLPAQHWPVVTVHLKENLQKLFRESGCQIPTIEFKPYEPPVRYDQKLRRIRRDFPKPCPEPYSELYSDLFG